MARQMTRDERIESLMYDNAKMYGDLRASRGYCEAYVDGMIAVEEFKSSKITQLFTQDYIEGYKAGYSDGYTSRGQMMKGPV